jgi:prepilin-type N-terminal cleavage/methylation domain-containing protein/prepilin-type processing-associated H-X9-DG protein
MNWGMTEPMLKPSCYCAVTRGFTLIELLVVLTVIAVLVGLLLPAIQATREASRRSQCVNNLKQLGLAGHSYMDAHRVLPLGGFFKLGSLPGTKNWMHGPLVGLLPFLGQAPLFNAFNCGVRFLDPDLQANNTVIAAQVATFLCPSDPLIGEGNLFWTTHGYQGWTGPTLTVGLTSYRANCGPWVNPPSDVSPGDDPHWQAQQDNALGVIYIGSATTLRDISDGTSSTLLFGEGVYGQLPPADQSNSHWWVAGNYGDTMQTATYSPNPGLEISTLSGGPASNRASVLVISASSEHPGGANFAFCDGSVRFLKDSIQSWPGERQGDFYLPTDMITQPNGTYATRGRGFGVYQALSTRAGGEVIKADAF